MVKRLNKGLIAVIKTLVETSFYITIVFIVLYIVLVYWIKFIVVFLGA